MRLRAIRPRAIAAWQGDAAVKAWVDILGEHAATIINAMAIAIIIMGAVETFFLGLRDMWGAGFRHMQSQTWIRFLRWLTAGLSFQLGADIIETSISRDWNTIGMLAAIAFLRTFLNFFLERDLTAFRTQRDIAPE